MHSVQITVNFLVQWQSHFVSFLFLIHKMSGVQYVYVYSSFNSLNIGKCAAFVHYE